MRQIFLQPPHQRQADLDLVVGSPAQQWRRSSADCRSMIRICALALVLSTTNLRRLSPGAVMLVLGAGAELRQPLGLAVVGGLLVSQVITLFITPVIFIYLDRFSGAGPLQFKPEPQA